MLGGMRKQATRSLRQEIRQTVPFRSAAQEVVLAIARTADVVTSRFERVLAPHGVTGQQYNVLRILRGARGAPLRTLEVGERMIQRTPGVTRLIDRLAAKGLVCRQPCPHDRRVVYCVITDAGLELLRRTDELIDGLEEEIGGAVNPGHLAAIIDGLACVRRAAE
jgi:MarR family transcriptional regulator, organic hydroperoxide resistance regulator